MPCKYYVALGECKKGREACHKGYCQHCGKYEPRAKGRSINRKKQYNRDRYGASGGIIAYGKGMLKIMEAYAETGKRI